MVKSPLQDLSPRDAAESILIDTLGVDAEECTTDALIEQDLGAESIDGLDIQFRAEKAVGREISQFNGKLYESMNRGSDKEVVAVEPPYATKAGTAARLAEIIERERETA